MRSVLAFAVLVLLAAPLRAQEEEQAPRLKSPEARARGAAEQLGLNSAQRRKVENLIRLETQEEEALIDKLLERRRRTRLAIQALLTPEQKRNYARIKEPPLVIGGSPGQAVSEGGGASDDSASAGSDDGHPGVLVDDDSHLPGQDGDDDGRPAAPPPARFGGPRLRVPHPKDPGHPGGQPGQRGRRRPAPPPDGDDAAAPGQGGDDHVMVDRDAPPADDSGGGDQPQQ